jgi:hypothetical protein
MKNPFTNHPNSIGETYFQHLFHALKFGFKMIAAGIACIIHAVFPFLFEKTGSNSLLKMTHRFIKRMPHMESRVAKLSQLINEKKSVGSQAGE